MYQTQFKTFKFYNKKEQRLAIYADVEGEEGDKYLEIFILRCSKSDEFNKKIADRVYENYKKGYYDPTKGIINRVDVRYVGKDRIPKVEIIQHHPQFYRVPIREQDKPRKEFIDFVDTHFYRKEIAHRLTLTVTEEDLFV